MVSSSTDCTICLWDTGVDGGQLVATFTAGSPVHSLAMPKKTVVAFSGEDGVIGLLWSWTGETLHQPTLPDLCKAITNSWLGADRPRRRSGWLGAAAHNGGVSAHLPSRHLSFADVAGARSLFSYLPVVDEENGEYLVVDQAEQNAAVVR